MRVLPFRSFLSSSALLILLSTAGCITVELPAGPVPEEPVDLDASSEPSQDVEEPTGSDGLDHEFGTWKCNEGIGSYDCSYIDNHDGFGYGLTFVCNTDTGLMDHIFQAIRESDGSPVVWSSNAGEAFGVQLDGGETEMWYVGVSASGDNYLSLKDFEEGDEIDLLAMQDKASRKFLTSVAGAQQMIFTVPVALFTMPTEGEERVTGMISVAEVNAHIEEFKARGCLL
jgi:hypothetical protein